MKKIMLMIGLVFALVSCENERLVDQYLTEVNKQVGNGSSSTTTSTNTVIYESDKAVLTVSGVSLNMIRVESGTFQMGSTGGAADETPVHSVILSEYYIGETEVTQWLWYAVMDGSNPYNYYSEYPILNVSWDECQEFIQNLNAKTGAKFSLPTEAEWEFAAKGGNKSVGYIYSGSNNIDLVAWYGDSREWGATHAVGTKKPNEIGVYDMSGNVWEWCQDWYGAYSDSTETDPTGPSTGSYRVNRGGCYRNDPEYCRTTVRGNDGPEYKSQDIGFRLVLHR